MTRLGYPTSKLRIGVSACLAGRAVRFNGGHCANGLLLREAADFLELVPACPEAELGLGTPRETLRLERARDLVVIRAPRSGADLTEAMRACATRRVTELKRSGLDGFVPKRDSPSCGMERVKVYEAKNTPSKTGVGAFADILMSCCCGPTLRTWPRAWAASWRKRDSPTATRRRNATRIAS